MEQLYLVEIFIKHLRIFLDEDNDIDTSKRLIIRAMFGPKTQFIFEENQMAYVDRNDDVSFEKKPIEAVGGGPPPELPAPEPAPNPYAPAQEPHGPAQGPHGPAQGPHDPAQGPHGPGRSSQDPGHVPNAPPHGPPAPGRGSQDPGHRPSAPPHGPSGPGRGSQDPGHGPNAPPHGPPGPGRGSQDPGHGPNAPPHGPPGPGRGSQDPGHGPNAPPHGAQGIPHDAQGRTSQDNQPTKEHWPQEEEVRGKKVWTRTFRIGKSYLFSAYPADVLLLLEKYPIEFSVWSDDSFEAPELLGTGNMHWHTQYFTHIKENMNPCFPYKALSSKEIIPIWNECCCTQAGDLYFVLRVRPLGLCIMTEFQQLLDKNPDNFMFRTDKCPSKFQCSRIEMDNPDYNTMGGLYEIACREDPEVTRKLKRKIEVCTELESCGVPQKGTSFACAHQAGIPRDLDTFITPKDYPIEKIKMGDIVGPCGNANCLLAHKMRTFIRNQYAYKRETLGKSFSNKGKSTKRVCGQCGCKHDLWHSEKAKDLDKKPICKGCGGVAQSGETCDDRLKNLHGTGVSPLNSKTELYRRQP